MGMQHHRQQLFLATTPLLIDFRVVAEMTSMPALCSTFRSVVVSLSLCPSGPLSRSRSLSLSSISCLAQIFSIPAFSFLVLAYLMPHLAPLQF